MIFSLLLSDPLQLFGINVINTFDFWELVVRFLFNLVVILVLVRLVYYPVARRKDYYFNFLLTGVIIFLITFSLINVKDISVGVALGLFAIFGILRFRTSQIPIKEMTYLFMVIGLSVINALVTQKISYAETLFINLVVILTAWIGEKLLSVNKISRKTILYDRMDLLSPENRDQLIADLKNRTGLNIIRIEIGKIDLAQNMARIRIFFQQKNQENGGLFINGQS
ncbi:MAG: DUF4956 domain-containing protein [Chlorobi bacterium]|nr:DUF4956 domain-containing protein [Chlorobiota bacterium]